MLRKTSVSVFALTLAIGFVALSGCKKKEPQKGTASDSKSEMTAPGMEAVGMAPEVDRPRVDPRPTTAPQGGRAGALPLPADFLYVKLNLKAARGTELYKQFEAKIKDALTQAMAKDDKGVAKALIQTCKLDPTSTIDELSFSMALGNETKGEAIGVISGTFEVAKLMACVKPELEKVQVTMKEVTVGGKKGMQFTGKDGKETTVVELSGNSFVIATGGHQAKMTAVLEGKSPSIEDAPIFKQIATQSNADTVLTVLVPTLPASITAAAPMPFLKDIKAATTLIGLPAGGIDIKAGLDIGDNEKADKLAKSIPLLIGLAKAKLPQVGETIAEALKVKAESGWVRIELALNKATFEKLMQTVQGMLGGALKGKMGGDDDDKPADMAADKPADMAADKPAAMGGK